MQPNYCLDFDRAPTTKAVGSEYVAKVGTDGFSRRTTKKRAFLTFETESLPAFERIGQMGRMIGCQMVPPE